MSSDPTKRFSNRVDNYIKYRPGYPPQVLDYLQVAGGLTPASVIADIGAGTGIFTKNLLDAGFTVYAVEPNKPMLDAAVKSLSHYTNFIPVNSTAGATAIPAGIIDMVVCAQAFHWFNNEETRAEFKRILKPQAKAALIWNNRVTDASDFSKAYNTLLLDNSVDYNKVNHANLDEIDFKAFFKNGAYQLKKIPNQQVFELEGLIGRAFSSSHVPAEDTVAGQRFLEMLKEVFNRYKLNSKVIFEYQTEIYWGEV